MSSLRAKLLAFLLFVISATWLATAALSYFDARHEIDELFDAQLAQSANVLLVQASHDLKDAREDDDGVAAEVDTAGHQYERKIAFQIWDRHDRLLLHSASAPVEPMAARDGGFADATLSGKAWRVYTQWDEEGEIRVQVGERHEVRDELAEHVARRLLLPLGVALPVLGLLLWMGVGKGLSPLQRIGREVARRDPANLAPLEEHGVPAEIAPLLGALNTLLGRLGRTLENERRFTADAAHELRTPLAALKTQAQVALRAADDSQRRNALENLVQGTDRATHLVEQLLTLARLDPAAGTSLATEPCDLVPLARSTLAELAPTALAKGVELELDGPDVAPATGNPAMLGILLRNLVDNAIRYTPAQGHVRVKVEAGRLEVCDSGPGIAAEERARVFDRFYRVLGHDVPGSGLGLSIVGRIAELHGAKVVLAEGPGGKGLRATVELPRGA